MINLSFSTISMLYTSSHGWKNRMEKIKQPANPIFETGHRLHRIMQDYLCGDTHVETLSHITHRFPIVEKVDRDPETKFTIPINENYNVIGYLDGINYFNHTYLEIKTGEKMWPITRFIKSPQRKIYALAHPELTHGILVTAISDDSQWSTQPPKVYEVELTQKDRDEAMEWIMGGIKIVDEGKFDGGLGPDGKCIGYMCNWGKACKFYGGERARDKI